MRKIVCCFIGVVLVTVAVAADVTDRKSCTDIKARIDSLAAQAELNDSEAALLTDLRGTYRRDCVARAAGRGSRTIASKRVGIKESVATTKTEPATDVTDAPAAEVVEEVVVADPCTTPDANGCCPGEEFADYGIAGKYCCKDDFCFPPMDVKPAEPEKTEEEIAAEIEANIEKGLCADGTKPNKYGCCAGEIFKDMGNSQFACCKKDSDECFPPVK